MGRRFFGAWRFGAGFFIGAIIAAADGGLIGEFSQIFAFFETFFEVRFLVFVTDFVQIASGLRHLGRISV